MSDTNTPSIDSVFEAANKQVADTTGIVGFFGALAEEIVNTPKRTENLWLIRNFVEHMHYDEVVVVTTESGSEYGVLWMDHGNHSVDPDGMVQVVVRKADGKFSKPKRYRGVEDSFPGVLFVDAWQTTRVVDVKRHARKDLA